MVRGDGEGRAEWCGPSGQGPLLTAHLAPMSTSVSIQCSPTLTSSLGTWCHLPRGDSSSHSCPGHLGWLGRQELCFLLQYPVLSGWCFHT